VGQGEAQQLHDAGEADPLGGPQEGAGDLQRGGGVSVGQLVGRRASVGIATAQARRLGLGRGGAGRGGAGRGGAGRGGAGQAARCQPTCTTTNSRMRSSVTDRSNMTAVRRACPACSATRRRWRCSWSSETDTVNSVSAQLTMLRSLLRKGPEAGAPGWHASHRSACRTGSPPPPQLPLGAAPGGAKPPSPKPAPLTRRSSTCVRASRGGRRRFSRLPDNPLG
jgi:hypothetical protein